MRAPTTNDATQARRPRVVRRALLALLVASASLAAPGVAAPTLPQPCEQLAVSPAYLRDGTVFCAGTTMDSFTPTGVALLVSTDRGRSWRRATALGLPYGAGERMTAFGVSPRYAADRTLIVSLRLAGVFVSGDAGETFTPLLPAAAPNITAFVSGVAGVDPTYRTTFIAAQWSLSRKPALVDPVTRAVQPVVGAPDPATEVVASPSWVSDHTALAFTDTGGPGRVRTTAYSCTATFDCSTKVATFPSGFGYGGAWFAADFPRSRTIFVQLVPDGQSGAPRLYVSRDAGATFRPLATAQALVSAHVHRPDRDSPPAVGIAAGPPGSQRLWMRVYGPSSGPRPALEIFRSENNGRTWVRVAWGQIARSPRGAMPELRVPPLPHQPRVLLAATADNHLFVNGITAGGWGLGCSRDGGRRWSMMCR